MKGCHTKHTNELTSVSSWVGDVKRLKLWLEKQKFDTKGKYLLTEIKAIEQIDYGGWEISSTGGFSEQIRPMSDGSGQEDPIGDKGM